MARKKIVFINFWMHTMDPVNVEHSHPTMRRILGMFDGEGVPADIYLENGLLSTIVEGAVEPGLLGRLRRCIDSGWGLAILRDSANPKPDDIYRDLSWDEAYKTAKRYQSHSRDIITGRLGPGPGGAELFKKALGHYPDICSRECVAEAFYLRERGALMSLGSYPEDWISSWVKPPLAWFMGMLDVHLYPERKNFRFMHAWSSDPVQFDREFREFRDGLPEADYHFVYVGNHNVDMYADNAKWNAQNRGASRHIEGWAFVNGNPPSRDAARIPDEFFYPPEKVEELFRQRQMVLKNFRRLANGDPGIRLVTCHQLLDAVVYEPKIKLSRSEVVEAAKFLCKHIRRGVPEYVTVGRRHLTLAETYHALMLSLEAFHHEGRLPEEVEVDWGLLGPVEMPMEWKPHGVRSRVEGATPSVEQLAECASKVAEEMREAKYPAVPVHTTGPWGQTPLNAAEMLWAMARAVAMVEDGKRGEIGLRYVSLYPEAVHWSSNPWLDDRHLQMFSRYHQLTALQLWTLKPAVLREDYE